MSVRYDAGVLTISFRPLAALKALAFAAAALALLLFPVVETARDDGHSVPPSPEAVAVERALTQRMALPAREIARLTSVLVRESQAAHLDPLLVLAVIEAESSFDHEAVSTRTTEAGACVANARGLMQVVNRTWNAEVRRRGLPSTLQRFDPVASVVVGTGYLGHLRERGFKRLDSLLVAYYLGPKALMEIRAGTAAPGLKAAAAGYVARVKRFHAKLEREAGPAILARR